jgi:hypothetical protein
LMKSTKLSRPHGWPRLGHGKRYQNRGAPVGSPHVLDFTRPRVFFAPMPRIKAAAPAPSVLATVSGLLAGLDATARTASSTRQRRSNSIGVMLTPESRAKASIWGSDIGQATIPTCRRRSSARNQSQMCSTSVGSGGRSPFHPLVAAASAKAISSSARPSRNLPGRQWQGPPVPRSSEGG